MDIFEIEAVDLQDIKKLVVGQNGSGDGNGWYLEKAILKVPMIEDEEQNDEDQNNDENANNNNNWCKPKYQEYNFTCNRLVTCRSLYIINAVDDDSKL